MSAFHFIGDLGTNAAVGAATGAACTLLFDAGSSMWLAMVAGMILGMGLGMIIATAAGIWFGAFEVMVPAMLSGMVAGMVVAMRAAHEPTSVGLGALWGGACGLASLAFTYLMNSTLRGERSYPR